MAIEMQTAPHETPAPFPQRASFARQWLLLVLFLLLLGLGMALNLGFTRQHVASRNEELLAAQAKVLARNLEQQTEAVDALLSALTANIQATPDQAHAAFSQRLEISRSLLPNGVRELLWSDTRGKVLAGSPATLVNTQINPEDWRHTPGTTRPGDMYIAVSPGNKQNKDLEVRLLHPLHGPDGALQGWVIARIGIEYFEPLLASVLHTTDMRSFVSLGNGTLLFSHPFIARMSGFAMSRPGSLFAQHMESGKDATVLQGPSAITQQDRIVAQHTVRGSHIHFSPPLVAAVSRSSADVFADWRSKRREYLVIWLATAMLSFALLALHQRRLSASSRRNAEARAAWRKADERLRTATQIASLGFWEYDPATDVLTWDASMSGITGYDSTHFTSAWEAIVSCLVEADRERAASDLDHASRNVRPLDSTYRLMRSDGAVRQIHVKGALRAAADAEGSRVVGTVEDITDRVRTEASLREAQELFRSAFDAAAIGQALVSTDGYFTQVNSALAHITGHACEELTGMHFQDITHPDDRNLHHTIQAELVAGQRQHFKLEKRYIHKRGEIIWVLITVSVVRDERGIPLLFMTQILDITESRRAEMALRDSESRFRSLVEFSPVAYQSLDEQGVILDVNDQFCDMLGYTRHELLGQAFRTLWTGDTHRQHPQLFRNALTPARIAGEFELLGKNGRIITAALDGRLQHDSRGQFIRFLCALHDISKRKQAERVLQDAKLQAEEASQAKSQFLANMSHEIRTPLSAVSGLCELLDASLLNPPQRELVSKLQLATTLLREIVNDILDFSRIDANRMEIEAKPFQLGHMLETTVTTLKASMRNRDIDLSLQIAPDVPLNVVGDRFRLQQVLLNLVGNAIKFTPRGTIRLEVSRRQHDIRVDEIEFAVEDTGIGILPERLEAIFAEFAQADTSITRRFGGTGLGLSISQRLVRLMGGELQVRSAPAQGSRFWFALRLPEMAATPDTPDASIEAAPTPSLRLVLDQQRLRLAGLRVLIVEDNELNRGVMAALLMQEGAHTTGAASGVEAVQWLSDGASAFDAVLMDLQMPGIGGLATTRSIRGLPRCAQLPIVALTAHVQPSDVQACLDAGMNAHLGKPIVIDQLVPLLLRLCRQEPAPTTPVATARPPDRLPQVPGFDLNDTLQRLGNNHHLYASAARRFRAGYANLPAHLAAQYQGEGAEAVAKILHTLKGTAATLGARHLSDYASSIRHQLLDEGLAFSPEHSERLAAHLEKAFTVLESTADILEAQTDTS
ncbi:MAG: PAS domain S-box protein [Rhodocyclaceae bacterium]